MDAPEAQKRGEICPRCLQPVSARSRKCPHCQEPLQSLRHVPILLGIFGLLALVFVVIIMLRVIRDNDLENAPSPNSEQDQSSPAQPVDH